ncbi:MAG TPA: hypothetical protein VLC47_02085 [Burkholderiales bacterium]|nr:hypothetical protein [Burkholderiales bacterium]
MFVLDAAELERMVRMTFPQKRRFSAEAELAFAARRPVFASVHGGCDPFLERQFEDWLDGAAPFVAPYQLLNRLCREGVLKPGDYAVRQRH